MSVGRRPSRERDRYRQPRHRLVERLRATGAITSVAVADAMRRIPRHRFLPDDVPPAEAYADEVTVLATDVDGFPTSTISQPSMVARMLDQLDVRPGDRVLEIGTASGYNAALLGELAGPDGSVVSVEFDPSLAAGARAALAAVGSRAEVQVADGWLGVPERAPFDRIIATVGVWDLSPAWADQLRVGGVLVTPLWLRPGIELSVAFHREPELLHGTSAVACAFLRLRGAHAGPEGFHPLDAETFASGELLDEAALSALRRIWSRPPTRTTDLPRLPRSWFVRLALGNPGALQLIGPGMPPRHAVGFFDPGADADHAGLAVVSGNTLTGYGAPEVTDWLRSALAAVAPLNPDRLRVDARRSGAIDHDPTARWLLARPEFDYWVAER